MGTIKGDGQGRRSFAVVMLLIAGVSATTVISCGGGGGDSSGELCQQCGDSDGPCLETVEVSGDERPSFCGTKDPCTVRLRCLQKLDSAQRRCFPVDPATNALDILYRCDGARPNPDDAPTTTPTPTPTHTATPTLTPSPSPTLTSTAATPTSTGPTPTGVTATPSGSTPTPTPAATPNEVTVTITIGTEGEDFTESFTATVLYPDTKGNFLQGGAADCDHLSEEFTAVDTGTGTLTLTFPGDPERTFTTDVDCTFHQNAGQALANSELSASVVPNSVPVMTDLSS